MSGKRTRSRRGNPRGKALGFRGLKPAAKTSSGADSNSSASASSAASAPSAPSNG